MRERTRQLQAEVAAHAESEQRVRTLVRQLVTAQEDERARVARDIHDHVGQQLTALRLSLDRLMTVSPTDLGAGGGALEVATSRGHPCSVQPLGIPDA